MPLPHLHLPTALSPPDFMYSVCMLRPIKPSLCPQMSQSVSLHTGAWSTYLASLPQRRATSLPCPNISWLYSPFSALLSPVGLKKAAKIKKLTKSVGVIRKTAFLKVSLTARFTRRVLATLNREAGKGDAWKDNRFIRFKIRTFLDQIFH